MTAPRHTFVELLASAVNEPGTISASYPQFHSYSIGNQLLAWAQCAQRGIPLGQPVTIKRQADSDDNATPDAEILIRFMYRPRWFVLAQTDGQELPPAEIPSWDKARTLDALNIQEIPFDCPDGNIMGHARKREIAISPLNPLGHKTRFHELAHVLLGHTMEGVQADGEITPRNLRECEAEAVALVCCAALNLPGVEASRGYIQSWWGAGNAIPERSAQAILRVADQILRAGREPELDDPEAQS